MKMLRSALVALSVLGITAGAVQGQRFGAQVNWGDDVDLGVGARLEIPVALASEGFLAGTFLVASFDYYFPDGPFDYFEFNGNFVAPVNTESNLNPYVGAGLNMARWSYDGPGDGASSTDLGLNLLGGIRFLLGSMSSFAEAKFEAGGGEQFVLTFGVMFGPNR